MPHPVRRFLVFEAAVFGVAALLHTGLLLSGYAHREARIAESVIVGVLCLGLLAIWLRSSWIRRTGIAAQGFALLGTVIGIFTVLVGVGPRTVLDVVYHVGIVLVLLWGLRVAMRSPAYKRSVTA